MFGHIHNTIRAGAGAAVVIIQGNFCSIILVNHWYTV